MADLEPEPKDKSLFTLIEAPPAPTEEAPPVVEQPDAEAETNAEPVESEAEATEAAVPEPDTPPAPEPEPEPEPPETKEDKLARFRKGKAIDEDAVAQEVAEVEAHRRSLAHINGMLAEDPELRLAYFRSLERKGQQLAPEWQAELDASRKIPVARTEKEPEPSAEDVRAEARKLFAQGKEDEAVLLMSKLVVEPTRKEMAELKAKLDSEEARRKKEAQAANYRDNEMKILAELQRIAEKHPKLMRKRQDGSVEFLDKEFQKTLAEASRGMQGVHPLDELAEYALFKLGRLGAKPKTSIKPAHKPPVRASAPPAKTSASAPAKGEFALELTTE